MAAESAEPETSGITAAAPVGAVPGVGARTARELARLGIRSLADLLRHAPHRYEYESAESPVSALVVGEVGQVRGTIAAVRWIGGGRGGGRLEATLEDERGDRLAVTWFNAGWLRGKLHAGMCVRLKGKVSEFRGYLQMANPKWEPFDPEAPPEAGDARYRPVYPATEGLPSARIAALLERVLPALLEEIEDPLPAALVRERAMPALAAAYRGVHQPQDPDEARAARQRLAYNELLLLQLGVAMKRHHRNTALRAPALASSAAIDAQVVGRFPFELTAAQRRVIDQVAGDLAGERPMNRLLQGDVGSGKTVVALYALLLAVVNGAQGALMAPTELLAEQHHAAIRAMLGDAPVTMELLTGSHPTPGTRARRALLERIAGGEVDLVVGTQALLGEAVEYGRLGVAVIDEQHRFGVAQRAAFRGAGPPDAAGNRPVPHMLVMTATPIPRTLSLTVFGDLDVSVIDQMPPGRLPIASRVVAPAQAETVYGYVAERLGRGEQAYVVVPAIDGEGGDPKAPLKNVQTHAAELAERYFRGYEVATVHGRIAREAREGVMDRFRRGEVHVLVATTVIEVGVDVPNATMMVIEHADRFGLAQLHQLRGRVGRGDHGRRSVCAFIAEPVTEEARARMETIRKTGDGFEVAEKDLEIRGMGDFFGTRQHGLPPLRMARLPEDLELLQLARRDAMALVEADPRLARSEHRLLKRVLLQHYGDALGLVDVG